MGEPLPPHLGRQRDRRDLGERETGEHDLFDVVDTTIDAVEVVDQDQRCRATVAGTDGAQSPVAREHQPVALHIRSDNQPPRFAHEHVGQIVVATGEFLDRRDQHMQRDDSGVVVAVAGVMAHGPKEPVTNPGIGAGFVDEPVDSEDRQHLVEYEAIATGLGDVTCLICDISAVAPERLVDAGCPHCPSLWDYSG